MGVAVSQQNRIYKNRQMVGSGSWAAVSLPLLQVFWPLDLLGLMTSTLFFAQAPLISISFGLGLALAI